MSQMLFLQHFNGFILHRTFVVYHKMLFIIFLKIKSNFIIGVFGVYVLLVLSASKRITRNRQYLRMKVLGSKDASRSFLQRTNCDITKLYIS